MILRSIFLNLFAASVVLLAIPVFTAAQTELPRSTHYTSGLLNFTRGQAVSLNFTNVAQEPKDVSLNFLDANGNVLKTELVRALPGQSVSISFSFTELPRTSSTRVGIRAVAVLVDSPDPDDSPAPELALVGVDIFDTQSSKSLIGLLLPAIRNANVFFPTDQ